MSNDRSELRWGVEQRLEFIEFRLFWEGHVNRSDVMTQFGLSVNQASSDLSRYIGFAPHNMDYDRSLRTYVRQPGFKPVFGKLDAGRYLAQLRSAADGILDHDDCWIAGLPAYDCAPIAGTDLRSGMKDFGPSCFHSASTGVGNANAAREGGA